MPCVIDFNVGVVDHPVREKDGTLSSGRHRSDNANMSSDKGCRIIPAESERVS